MGIKEIISNWIENKKEKAEFRKAVEAETLPIRRAAYLEAKKKQAIAEGKAIAQKEFQKNQQQQTKPLSSFGLTDPTKFINNKEDKK